MRTHTVVLAGAAALAVLAVSVSRAQLPPAPAPVKVQQPGPPSPQIHPDRTATISLYAPKAAEVLLNGDWGNGMPPKPISMTRDAEGVWTVKVGPLAPEMWGYTFSVDGVRTLDPRNSNTKRDGARYDNILLIPGPESELYELKNVPHGTVSAVWYPSPTLKMDARRAYVYTPPGYETSNQRYPVLYLLHGGGGDEDAWNTLGRTSMIMDNLIAQGKARPFIVVMPNGNANQSVSQGYALGAPPAAPVIGARAGPVPGAPAAPQPDAPVATQPFPESLVKDIIPFIEKRYRVIANRDSRAIAGLSMGGGHTLAATMNHPGVFGYIGVLSSGARGIGPAFEKQLQAVKAGGVRLYYVGCGLKDTGPMERSRDLVAVLNKHDIKNVLKETPGAHTWFTWRILLSDFAQLFFK